MSPTCFWSCSLWEVIAAIEGQRIKEERTMRNFWEMFRFSAFYSLMPHAKKNTLKRPRDIASFPWDVAPKSLKKEEVKTLFDRIKQQDKKDNG